MFQVSVITPVYNAATTVQRAVESAVDLPEVGEILLIDDAGPDNALAVCGDLEARYEKIRLLRHPDHGNHGAGASRNLGIENARFPFIAFLDADDYYLPNRFVRDREILSTDPSVDGVYGGTGIEYEDVAARERFHAAGFAYQEFTTLSGAVPSEDLFAVLFHQHPTVKGEFHTDAITIRKSLLDRVGGFHPDLRLQQDIHLWRRLAAVGRIEAGNINEPVAIRGVHSRNRMTDLAEHEKYHRLWWDSLAKEFRRLRIDRNKFSIFRKARASYLVNHGGKAEAATAVLSVLLAEPSLLFESNGYFDLNLLALTRRDRLALRIISAKNRFLVG
jgi:glycosyltransferase involved in cell wall biosynthesis